MVVAATAFECQAQEGGSECIDTIHHVGNAKFLFNNAPLFVLHVQTIERRGQLLLFGRVGQQVSGKLPRNELIERQIFVERLNYPISIGPHRTGTIGLIAMRVGITGHIEPLARQAFPVARRSQQSVDDLLVSVGRRVGQERINFGRRRWKTRQIEGDAAMRRARSASGLGV